MLRIITGKQRAGKTYFCVPEIRDCLKRTNRNIYSNLPLNPDILCDWACGGKNRHPALYASYLRRIRLFHDFHCSSEAKEFIRKNRDWFKLRKSDNKRDRLLLTNEQMLDFWNHKTVNSILFLDELYQWFGTEYTKENFERRKELLTYTRQHGHYKDDLYLISHKIRDLDVHIRGGCQYLYLVKNSKYENVFNNRWMRGFKWPYQFFMVEGYDNIDALEAGFECEPSDYWRLPTDKKVFECYNSFSSAETLSHIESDSDFSSAESSDTGLNFWYNLRKFFSQAWIGVCFLMGIVVFFIYMWFFVDDLLLNPAKVETQVKQPQTGQGVNDPEEKRPVIKAVFPRCIIWSDDFELRTGGSYYGCKVEKITRNFVLFSRGHKSFRVKLDGIRLLETVQKSAGKDGAKTTKIDKKTTKKS